MVEIVPSGAFEKCCRRHSSSSVHSETYFSFASVADRNRSVAQETVVIGVSIFTMGISVPVYVR